MARAWILASCSWTGKAAGGSSSSIGGSANWEPGACRECTTGSDMPDRRARARDRRGRHADGAASRSRPSRGTGIGGWARRSAGPGRIGRTSGSSQSPDATRAEATPTAGGGSDRPAEAAARRRIAEPAADLLERPADQDLVAERQAEQARRPPGSGPSPRAPNCRSRKTAARARHILRCRPAGSARASGPACGRPRRRRPAPSRTRSPRPARSGTAPAADQEQVDDEQGRRDQPARPADRREHRVCRASRPRVRTGWSAGCWAARRQPGGSAGS